jgi:Zn-dependent protease with chaperone function
MHAPHGLDSQWFDGHSPRAQSVRLWIEGGELVLHTEGGVKRFAVAQVQWPERRSHGQRQADLPDGSLIQHADAAEWDAWWQQASGMQEGAVVGWMQSWRATLWSMAGTLAFLAAAWVWGVPWLSSALTVMVPQSLEARIGQQGFAQLERLFLQPSRLPQAQQDALRQRFSQLVQRNFATDDTPVWTLSFHASKRLGANAFALPGGVMVMTDDLVSLLQDQPDALMGVLAHELGHVERRHGLDMMVRAGLISALVGVVLGDASGFLATVPATLATQSYSRDAERESDEFAAQMLDRGGLSPAVMAVFFERIIAQDGGNNSGAVASTASTDGPASDADEETDAEKGGRLSLPIAISSHPDHEARIRFFKAWRARPSLP